MSDLIDRQDAIDAAIEAADTWDGCYSPERERMITERMKKVPAAQSEIEKKIKNIGYTGKEGKIYIGGRLFAVRELAQ